MVAKRVHEASIWVKKMKNNAKNWKKWKKADFTMNAAFNHLFFLLTEKSQRTGLECLEGRIQHMDRTLETPHLRH